MTVQDKPFTMIIFGASGDLTHRKLMPSLYNLYRKQRLPANLHIVGFSNDEYHDEDFRDHLPRRCATIQ